MKSVIKLAQRRLEQINIMIKSVQERIQDSENTIRRENNELKDLLLEQQELEQFLKKKGKNDKNTL